MMRDMPNIAEDAGRIEVIWRDVLDRFAATVGEIRWSIYRRPLTAARNGGASPCAA